MIRELLDERSTISTMRLMSLISMTWACVLSGYGVYAGKDLMSLCALVSVFITAAFGGKITQKFIEKRSDAQE